MVLLSIQLRPIRGDSMVGLSHILPTSKASLVQQIAATFANILTDTLETEAWTTVTIAPVKYIFGSYNRILHSPQEITTGSNPHALHLFHNLLLSTHQCSSKDSIL